MPITRTDEQTAEQTQPQQATVLPFSRERLGRGARVTQGSRELAERRDSPVYLPGDPRITEE